MLPNELETLDEIMKNVNELLDGRISDFAASIIRVWISVAYNRGYIDGRGSVL